MREAQVALASEVWECDVNNTAKIASAVSVAHASLHQHGRTQVFAPWPQIVLAVITTYSLQHLASADWTPSTL